MQRSNLHLPKISSSAASDIRTNADLANLHSKAAELLRRIADSGEVSSRDKAMARIYSTQLERRRRVGAVQPTRHQ